MPEYKIQAVSPETRTYDTKYGQMISYKLKLEGVDTPVELGQKTTTPAPQEGGTLNGTIDTSGQYGPKFKKENAQFGGGFGSPTASTQSTTSTGRSDTKSFDSFTMYLSYAKDLAVALLASDEAFDSDKYGLLLEEVIAGGKTLYNDRPGAEPKVEPQLTQADVEKDDSEEAIKKKVNDFFADIDSDIVDLS
jgi:hypothetical protein